MSSITAPAPELADAASDTEEHSFGVTSDQHGQHSREKEADQKPAKAKVDHFSWYKQYVSKGRGGMLACEIYGPTRQLFGLGAETALDKWTGFRILEWGAAVLGMVAALLLIRGFLAGSLTLSIPKSSLHQPSDALHVLLSTMPDRCFASAHGNVAVGITTEELYRLTSAVSDFQVNYTHARHEVFSGVSGDAIVEELYKLSLANRLTLDEVARGDDSCELELSRSPDPQLVLISEVKSQHRQRWMALPYWYARGTQQTSTNFDTECFPLWRSWRENVEDLRRRLAVEVDKQKEILSKLALFVDGKLGYEFVGGAPCGTDCVEFARELLKAALASYRS